MKTRSIILSILLTISLIFSSCKKDADVLRTNLINASWSLTNHCDEYGFLNFSADNTGTMLINDECNTGYPCSNALPFNWSISETTLIVSYTNNSAMIICSEGPDLAPSGEQINLGTEPTLIKLYNHSFENGKGDNNTTTLFDGKWERHDVTSYLEISGSSAKLCNGSIEWTGTFSESENKLYMSVDGETYDFDVEISGFNLIVYPGEFSSSHDPSTYYTTSNYPC